MANYKMQYKIKGSNTVTSTAVNASSASDAKEQIKAKYKGDVVIVSCVERK